MRGKKKKDDGVTRKMAGKGGGWVKGEKREMRRGHKAEMG